MAVLAATDFFTVEVLTRSGLMTYYVLFFIQLESRKICVAGVTRHPDQEWMAQMARNVTMEDSGFLIKQRHLHSFYANSLPRSSLLVVDIDLGTATGLLAFTEIILKQGEFPNWEKIILRLGRS